MTLTPAQISVVNLRIAPIFGSIITTFFTFGVVMTKGWQYYSVYTADPWPFKAIVAVSIAWNIANCACYGKWAYSWLIVHFGDPSVAAIIPKIWLAGHLGLSINALMVETFFAWRIYVLGGGWMRKRTSLLIPGLIVAFGIVGCVNNLIVTYETFVDDKFADLNKKLGIYWGSFAAASDLVITVALGYYLMFKNRDSTIKTNTSSWIKGIMLRAIQTNVLITTWQIVFFIGLYKIPGSWFLTIVSALPQLYTFSLLVSLTSRPVRDQDTLGMTLNTKASRTGGPLKVNVDIQSHRVVDQGVTFSEDKTYGAYDVALQEVRGGKIDNV